MQWEFKNGKNQKCNLQFFHEKSLKITVFFKKDKFQGFCYEKNGKLYFQCFYIFKIGHHLSTVSYFFIMIAFKVTEL